MSSNYVEKWTKNDTFEILCWLRSIWIIFSFLVIYFFLLGFFYFAQIW